MREMGLLTVGSELIQDGRRLRATIVTSANRNTERPLGKRASHDEATQGSRKQGTSWPNNHTMERPRRCFTGSSWHSDCTVSARQVHAGHSSGDDARRRDDVAYFLWDHDPGSDSVASLLPHHPLRRAGKMASCLAAIDVGSSALAALCAGACDHDDRLDLWIRAWLVDFAVLRGPSPNVADRRLAARK
jgi:hypothetical protein